MAKKRRYRTKEAREIADEVIAAGGSIELTAIGHLKVTGPAGTAIVQSELTGPGAYKMVTRTIARYAGLRIRER